MLGAMRGLSLNRCYRFCMMACQTGLNCTSVLEWHVRHKSEDSILSASSVLYQDGNGVQEIPMVIRKLDLKNQSDIGPVQMKVAENTAQDELFHVQCQDCDTVQEVLQMLEVGLFPLTLYTASYALERIYGLKQKENSVMGSGGTGITVDDLWELVSMNTASMDSSLMMTLVKCHLDSSLCREPFRERIDEELRKRIGDGVFSIEELCGLIDIVTPIAAGDTKTAHYLWVHLGSRYRELGTSEIIRVYQSMKYLSPRQKHIWNVVDKRLKHLWWELNGDEVSLIMLRMAVGDYSSQRSLTNFSKWLYLNIQRVTDDNLMSILSVYRVFDFSNPHIFDSLELYVKSNIHQMSKSLIVLLLEYCTQQRYVSRQILNAISTDLVTAYHRYSTRQMVTALQTFGHLNYLPPNKTQLFSVGKKFLSDYFHKLENTAVVELLTSFAYLEFLPVKMLRQVFSRGFLRRVLSLPSVKLQKCGCQILELQAALFLDFPGQWDTWYLEQSAFGLTVTHLG